jgi:hypothetical protein
MAPQTLPVVFLFGHSSTAQLLATRPRGADRFRSVAVFRQLDFLRQFLCLHLEQMRIVFDSVAEQPAAKL